MLLKKYVIVKQNKGRKNDKKKRLTPRKNRFINVLSMLSPYQKNYLLVKSLDLKVLNKQRL